MGKRISQQACETQETETVPDTMTIGGVIYKNVGSKAFAGIHRNPTVKVPKKKLKAYKKFLKKKGMPRKARVKK